jgi:hypothetical protein
MRLNETNFLNAALSDALGIWSAEGTNRLANHPVPDSIFNRRAELLKGDVNFEWAVWFSEGLSDPLQHVQGPVSFATIFHQVWSVLRPRFTLPTDPELEELCSVIARSLLSTVQAIKDSQSRTGFSSTDKRNLLDLAGSPPRCWICGVQFEEASVENFVSGSKHVWQPLLLDVLRPRGLTQRDFKIEIDHVIPFSRGGGDGENLRLACGWCNRYKSNLGSVYDAQGRIRTAGPNGFGLTSLPQPYWVIRLLAMVGHCEHIGGCTRTIANSLLTVTPDVPRGSLNPTNLRVTCLEHDPLGAARFQPVEQVRLLWSKRSIE